MKAEAIITELRVVGLAVRQDNPGTAIHATGGGVSLRIQRAIRCWWVHRENRSGSMLVLKDGDEMASRRLHRQLADWLKEGEPNPKRAA